MSATGLDLRTRFVGDGARVDAREFFATEWRDANEHNGARAASDATYLGLTPVGIAVGDRVWTIAANRDAIDAIAQHDATGVPTVRLEPDAFTDLVCERRTALGLVVAGRVEGTPDALGALTTWDPVLRSLLDGRSVYRPGTIDLRDRAGEPLELTRRFRLDAGAAERADAAHFLAEAGFVVLAGVFDDTTMDSVDIEFARAVAGAAPDDGASWWASTRDGTRYPCRILDFAERSPALRTLVDDARFLAIGSLLGVGHRPGDPFGEHFADVTAEALTKRVDSVDGLVCLPWHKDCERGGHSSFCCGLTIGICLTPADVEHGGLDVYAGSHRANIARVQFDGDLDLPAVALRAERGDVSVHLSCTLHRSTHPRSAERRVVYTGFKLPPRTGDLIAHGDDAVAYDQARLRRDRSALGSPTDATQHALTIDRDAKR